MDLTAVGVAMAYGGIDGDSLRARIQRCLLGVGGLIGVIYAGNVCAGNVVSK